MSAISAALGGSVMYLLAGAELRLWALPAAGALFGGLTYLLLRSCSIVDLMMNADASQLNRPVAERPKGMGARIHPRDLRLLTYISRVAHREKDERVFLQAVLKRMCRHVSWPVGHIYRMDQRRGRLESTSVWNCPFGEEFNQFRHTSESYTFGCGEDLIGRALADGSSVVMRGIDTDCTFRRQEAAASAGLQTAMAIPIIDGVTTWGVVEFLTDADLELDDGRMAVLALAAEQLGESLLFRRVLEGERRSVRRLEGVIQSKGELLANISHDIRTPLNGILGMTDLALTSELPPAQRVLFDTVHECTHSVLDFLNDILDFSKIEAGKLELECVPFDPGAIVDEVLMVLGHSASNKSLALMGDVTRDVPSVVVGDPTRLRQVLMNLVGNAIKFTERGDVMLTMQPEILRENAVTLLISVSDTGIGISEENLQQIFESFEQVDGSGKRQLGGTGLGLAICRKLIELQDGEIKVSSHVGVGSTFTIRLTYGLSADASIASVNDRPIPFAPDLTGRRVLVADACLSQRGVLSRWVGDYGGQTVQVSDLAQAVTSMRSAIESTSPFEFLILDDGIPGYDDQVLMGQIVSMSTSTGAGVIILRSLTSLHAKQPEGLSRVRLVVRPVRRRVFVSSLQSLRDSVEVDQPSAPSRWARNRANARVLLAEDHWVSRMVTRRILHSIGCEVVEVENGKAAVERFRERPFDLVLMDLRLPVLDGLDACRRIRQLEGGRDVPIVALTAHALDEIHTECRGAGMNDELEKPLSVERLTSILERHAPETIQASDDDEALLPDAGGFASECMALDVAGALKNLRGDRELFEDALASLLRSVPELIDRLREAMDAQSIRDVEAAAHSIRGAASVVSAKALQERCANIQRLATAGIGDTVAQEVALLACAFEDLRQEVGRHEFRHLVEDAADQAPGSRPTTVTGHASGNEGPYDADGGASHSVPPDASVAGAAESELSRTIEQVAETPDEAIVTESGEATDVAPVKCISAEESAALLDDLPIVLIVDDSPTNRGLCRSCLQNKGYRLLEAADGEEGYSLAVENLPDVIIMDIMMPKMDGLECTRLLRQHDATADIPIIVLSAMNADDDILRGFEAGANEYLSKPFRTAELALRVKSMVTLNRTRIELLHQNHLIATSNKVRGEQARSLGVLLELSFALSNATEADEIARRTVAAAARLTGCRRAALLLPNEDETALLPVATSGMDGVRFPAGGIPIDSAFLGECFRTGMTIESVDSAAGGSAAGGSAIGGSASRGFQRRGDGVIELPERPASDAEQFVLQAMIDGCPVLTKAVFATKTVGILFLCGRETGEPFSDNEQEYLDVIANLAGSTLSDLQHRVDRDAARESIVLALATLAEWRDTDTGRHLDRVTQYALLLANDLMMRCEFEDELNEYFLEDLGRAMPLHDIGKVAIPDAILRKSGRLTDEEMERMKTHTEYGAKAIHHIRERAPRVSFLGMAEDIARCHHERYDGSGYPGGLVGREIPLSARIAAVADVYDALTTRRPYKEAFSHEKSARIIMDQAGSHFDPAVVAAFQRSESLFEELAEKLRDSGTEQPGVQLAAAGANVASLRS